MTAFVDQEYLHDSSGGIVGDCWRASLASILGRPLPEVPHFVRDFGDGDWFPATNRWLAAEYGEEILYYDRPDAVRAEYRLGETHREFVILNGDSPRGPFPHCVVADAVTGQVVHDPHPSRDGITAVTGVFALVAAAACDA